MLWLPRPPSFPLLSPVCCSCCSEWWFCVFFSCLKFKELHLGEEQCREREPWSVSDVMVLLGATIFPPAVGALNDNAWCLPEWGLHGLQLWACDQFLCLIFAHKYTTAACPQTTSHAYGEAWDSVHQTLNKHQTLVIFKNPIFFLRKPCACLNPEF